MADNEERDEIGQIIQRSCEVPPPDEQFVRSLATRTTQELAAASRRQFQTDTQRTRRGSPAVRRIRRAALIIAGAAAAMLISMWLWSWHETRLWAQVVEAVRAKPWIHAVAEPGEGAAKDVETEKAEKFETWLAMKNAVAAQRCGGWAAYDDGRFGIRQEYDPKKQVLYRLPLYAEADKGIRAAQRMFAGLFRGDDQVNLDIGRVLVTKQQRRQVSERGQKWIEYTLTVNGPPGPSRVVLRVDPQTRLPQSMECFTPDGPTSAAKPRVKIVFDYPEDGPADICALGVPRSAETIDRAPKPNLAKVLDGVKTSRQRFADSYYAIVAETIDAKAIRRSDKWWQSSRLHQVWCKGEGWRVELGSPCTEQNGPGRPYTPAEPPGPSSDKMAWWKAHLREFTFQPSGVCDGRAIYLPKHPTPGPQAKPGSVRWETWCKITPGYGRQHSASVGAGTYIPEFYAYPVALGEPGRESAAELAGNPSEQPAGTVLVKYRITSTGAIPSCRYWVDPARTFVTVRQELGEPHDTKAGPDAGWPDTYVAEEFARTPSGIWYATAVRRLWPDGRSGTVYWIFVDFKAEVPDNLFRPGPLVVDKAPQAPASTQGAVNLRQIAAAMLRYHDEHRTFPAAYTIDKQGKPLLSWRVRLLPLLEHAELYKQFHLDEPWDSEHNRKLIEKMPEVYGVPASRLSEKSRTTYVVPVGKETAFPGANALGANDIRDGCANTIMAVKVNDDHAVIWTKPEDLPFDAASPAEGPTALPREGFWVVLCDGSVRWIPKDFDPKYLHAAFTRAGGETIEW